MILEDKSVVNIKKRENTYIYNFDACVIYKAMIGDTYNYNNELVSNKGNYSTKKTKLDLLFTATIPYSLEMLRLDEYYNKDIYVVNKKQYTKSIINIRFDSNCVEWMDKIDKDTGEILTDDNGKAIRVKKTLANKKKMRKYLYKNGFVIDNQKYIFYKRGASKARTGSCLFIKEEMYDKLMNRSRLIHNKPEQGLYFKENEVCDITSLNAYQSLILSGLEDIIEIPKESILIIDDIGSKPFKTISSVTTEENGVLKTETKEVTRVNNMTDGQGLMDESLFELVGRQHKGMMLLRSDLFKCCAFNTKLQKFFEYMDSLGKIKDGKILDKYRGWVDYKNIKLVTTPSSVKYLKFKNKFNNEIDCYMGWFDNIDNIFGIVKSDKEGNYGSWNRTTYQIINSMPFTKEQLKELMKPELEYINLLKTDISYFKNHIAVSERATEELEKDIELLDWDNEEDVETGGLYNSGEMINNILSINSDFQHTKIFKQFRIDQIKCYINELRKGKFRLENTIYATIVANPYEMLLHSIGLFNGECLAKGFEMYCKSYNNNQELATFRNPHINSGNVMLAKNVWHDEYKWFNLTNNITIVNVSDNDFPDRGQGFDYDSDTLLHIPHKIFVEVARQCQVYKTPLNSVKGDSKIRRNNLEELAELDNILSNNFIGKIINKSQIVNSYMWDCKAKGKDKKLIDELYDISSMLSSLSQIELDKAKKSFDNVSMPKELKNINDMTFEGETVIGFNEEEMDELDNNGNKKKIKKMTVPKFFEYVAQDNTYRNLIKFETPMDYLEEILDESKTRNIRKTKRIGELMVKAKSIKGDISRTRHIEAIFDICNKYYSRTKYLMINKDMVDSFKSILRNKYKEEALEGLNKLNISGKTIYSVTSKCFGENIDKNWSKMGMIVMMMLYNSKHKLKLLSVFKSENNMDEVILLKHDDGSINIFGDSYLKIKRRDVIFE